MIPSPETQTKVFAVPRSIAMFFLDKTMLLKLKGIGRVRGRKLFNNGIRTLGDVKKAELVTLGQLIGKNVAEDLKKQLGEKTIEVKPNKRKGQIALEDYGE